MPDKVKTRYYCEKCGKTMDENQFFTYKDGSKTELCKKCLTMHIDNFDPDTFLWLLEKMDVPYIPTEWNTLRDRIYEKDPNKLTSSSVFGRYLSKMKLRQWKDYSWADTERLQKEFEEREEEERKRREERDIIAKERFENGEISEAEYKTLTSTEARHADGDPPAEIPSPMPVQPATPAQMPTPLPNNPWAVSPVEVPIPPMSINAFDDQYMGEDELPDPAADLTEEDKVALAVKWGRMYKPNEWVELETDYDKMPQSFDIQDADTKNTLILICKTNLKMNQALDIGDIDSFQKLSKVSENLRKSAKFTAAQNKESKNDFVDSVGELVSMCEREGFIPRYATDIPQDKVDFTLKDMNDYLYKLVTQDLGFGQQIEDALKKIQIQKEMNEALEEGTTEVEDEDYEAFLAEAEKQKEADQETFAEQSIFEKGDDADGA